MTIFFVKYVKALSCGRPWTTVRLSHSFALTKTKTTKMFVNAEQKHDPCSLDSLPQYIALGYSVNMLFIFCRYTILKNFKYKSAINLLVAI